MSTILFAIDSFGISVAQTLQQGTLGIFFSMFFLVCNALFHPMMVTLGLILLWYRAHVVHKDKLFAAYLIVFASAGALVTLLKAQIERARPVSPAGNEILYAVFGSSFPSAHALMATVVVGLLAVYIVNSKRKAKHKDLIIFSSILIILSIGYSRVYFGVHWLTDVIVGWILGALIVGACYIAIRDVRRRKARLHEAADSHRFKA